MKQKNKEKEKRIEILKTTFPHIDEIIDFDLLSISRCEDNKYSEDFVKLSQKIISKIMDFEFIKRHNESIYLNQILGFIVNQIKVLKEEIQKRNNLSYALKENIQNTEIAEKIKNDGEIWKIAKIENPEDFHKIKDFKIPKILEEMNISKEEIYENLEQCNSEQIDFFDKIVTLYLQKKEIRSEDHKQRKQLDELEDWKEKIEKFFK